MSDGRWVRLLLMQLAGALAGGWAAYAGGIVTPVGAVAQGLLGALIGSLLCSWLWLWKDCQQAQRLWRWLQTADLTQESDPLDGIWAILRTQSRRWLRSCERAVDVAEQRVHDILGALQASPNGLVLLDGSGRIEWCNQMSERQFGFDAQRDVQQSIGNLVRDPAFSNYWQLRDFTHPVIMVGRESTPARPVTLSVHIHPYGEGRHLLLSRDITALEQAEAMRRDFVANVSHEVRTPLTVLAGFVETLQTLDLSREEQQRYLALMAQQATRMQNLVQDLLTLSRLEGSPLPGYRDRVSVAALLHQCEVEARVLSQMLAKSSGKADQVHVLQFPSTTAPGMDMALIGAQPELMSAFSNLISNALRYTPLGGLVQVCWQVLPDGQARFAVKDSGPGIDPSHIDRLTERFYRIDRSRSRDTGGTGLGLAIVKHALQRHGAVLKIESKLGEGTTFSAIFPANRLVVG